MRFLADASFPTSICQPNAHGINIDRYSGRRVDDAELLSFASSNGYAAVLMLGSEVLADPLVAGHPKGKVNIVVTVSHNPIEAVEQLLPRLDEVVKRLPTDPVIVMGKAGVLSQAV